MFEIASILLSSFFLYVLPLFLILRIRQFFTRAEKTFPTSYPLVGHLIAFKQHQDDRFRWLSNLIVSSPTSTFTVHRPFGQRNIMTGNPTNVEHMLKSKFAVYQKGQSQNAILKDLLGDGIFNVDGHKWKFQRQVASYEFSTKSLRKFIENVVDSELSSRLIPVLQDAVKNQTVLDMQDILQMFAFDNICKIAFGYDPEYLTPSLPQAKFAVAFEEAVMISSLRFRTLFPISWKIRRLLNIGSEKKFREAVVEIREFANSLIRQKKEEMLRNSEGTSLSDAEDLLSRFLKSGHTDEKFITDIVISFMLAGRDTTSSALTWFFWLLSKNKQAEEEIVEEINSNMSKKTRHSSGFEEAKDMVYIHAAICESMRLYPPVAADSKEATTDDVLPDGTPVKKGMLVTYHPYAMGRLESSWGPDWAEFRPERWLESENNERWKFVPRDPYTYPVFQAGPRVCLGKEMALLQMKRIVAGVLERFRVVPVLEEGFEPEYIPNLTAKMKGGLPVRIEERLPTK